MIRTTVATAVQSLHYSARSRQWEAFVQFLEPEVGKITEVVESFAKR